MAGELAFGHGTLTPHVFEATDIVLPAAADWTAVDPDIGVIGAIEVDPRRGYFQNLYVELPEPQPYGISMYWAFESDPLSWALGAAIEVPPSGMWTIGPAQASFAPQIGAIAWASLDQSVPLVESVSLQLRVRPGGNPTTQPVHVARAIGQLLVI